MPVIQYYFAMTFFLRDYYIKQLNSVSRDNDFVEVCNSIIILLYRWKSWQYFSLFLLFIDPQFEIVRTVNNNSYIYTHIYIFIYKMERTLKIDSWCENCDIKDKEGWMCDDFVNSAMPRGMCTLNSCRVFNWISCPILIRLTRCP